MFVLRRQSFICQLCSHSRRFYANSAKSPKPSKKVDVVASLKTRKTKKGAAIIDEENSLSKNKPLVEPASRKTRLEQFLDELDTSQKPPTLDELLNLKPINPADQTKSVGPDSKNYAEEYEAAVKRVSRAFSTQQIREFLNLLKFNNKLPTTQRGMVQILLQRAWDWPSPHEVQGRTRIETERITRAIPISPASLFLLIGEEGRDLQALGQINDVACSIMTEGGTFIEVDGVESNLRAFADQIAIRESRILTERVPLDNLVSLPTNILSRISQRSKAFVDSSRSGSSSQIHLLEISAFTLEAVEKAKRSIERYIQQRRLEAQIPLVAEVPFDIDTEGERPSDRPEYALYPYRPPRAVPWILEKQGLFRVKRVTDVVEMSQTRKERLLDFDESSQAKLNMLLQEIENQSVYERSWTVRTGHVAFTIGTSGIVPPISGKWSMQGLMGSIGESNMESHFLPSVPSILQESSPALVDTVHRVIYRQRLGDESKTYQNITRTPIFLLEVIMKHTVDAPELDDLDAQDSGGESITLHPLKALSRCQEGFEGAIDAILPDRAMDFRFTVRDLRPVEEVDEPQSIKGYLEDLVAFLNFTRDDQPSAPTEIVHNGVQYVLELSTSIRRADEVLTMENPDWNLDPSGGLSEVAVACESSLDLESKEKRFECIVETTQCGSSEDWDRFMAQCSTVTTVPFRSVSKEFGIRFSE